MRSEKSGSLPLLKVLVNQAPGASCLRMVFELLYLNSSTLGITW